MPVSDPIAVIVDPLKNQKASIIWTLYYRANGQPHSLVKNFNSSAELRDVITRCKDHCDKMNFRFVKVMPFLSDLQADELKNTEYSG